MRFILLCSIFFMVKSNYVLCDDSNIEIIDDREVMKYYGLSFLSQMNPNKTTDGRRIIQGDIVLPRGVDALPLPYMINRESKKATEYTKLWPNGYVFYEIHSSVDDKLKEMIEDSIEEWENNTCLRFVELGNRRRVDDSYIIFRADMTGCFSDVGKFPYGGQYVSIGKNCDLLYIISHEIGHAIGFHHEQSRSDRDNYIHILWENVDEKKGKYNLYKAHDNPRGVEYDYTSIMHYEPMDLSIFPFRKNTFVSLNPLHQTLMGSGRKLSFRDAKLANLMYKCNNDCPNQFELECLNGGYLSPYRGNGADCTCICPPNTSGESCENAIYPLEYYDPLQCGGNITEETIIQTPGYPMRDLPFNACIWWIQAPEDHLVKVEFLDFSFHPRSFKSNSIVCFYESVEIRIEDRYDGDMYCGEEIPPGTVVVSTEKMRDIIIIIDIKKMSKLGRGLKAKVTFVDENILEKPAPLSSFLPGSNKEDNVTTTPENVVEREESERSEETGKTEVTEKSEVKEMDEVKEMNEVIEKSKLKEMGEVIEKSEVKEMEEVMEKS